ncbi:MAG: hypothetical protein ACXVLQ_08210 [Bacteriovorax sp.]
MKKALAPFLFVIFCTNAWSLDLSLKADAQYSSTDNVNLTNTNQISDSYSTLGGYLQAKNETWKLKLRGKVEKYKEQKENDNYSTELSLQYKRTKANDYTIGIFQQVYNGTPLVTTDTTSDNSGARLSTTFSHDFDKDTNGYFSAAGTYKKYSKIAGRNDKILTGALGLEHYFSSSFMVNPELSLQNNGSADPYYSNVSYGPSILLSFTPDDKWEIYLNGSYSHTRYSGRNVATTVRGRTTNQNEYQNLTSADIGATYTLEKLVSLQAKYSTGTNASNNSTSAYKVNVISFGLGLKF